MIVALLHDVVDDTPATLEEVEAEFGAEIALKVEKVSQLSSLNQLLRRNRRQLLEAGKVDSSCLHVAHCMRVVLGSVEIVRFAWVLDRLLGLPQTLLMS